MFTGAILAGQVVKPTGFRLFKETVSKSCSADVWIKPCHIQKPVPYKPAAHGGVDSAVLEPISLSLVTGKPAHYFLNTMTYDSFKSQGPHVL